MDELFICNCDCHETKPPHKAGVECSKCFKEHWSAATKANLWAGGISRWEIRYLRAKSMLQGMALMALAFWLGLNW